MIFKRRPKHYLIFSLAEATLALHALLSFRNKTISRGIDPVDIDGLIKKIT